MKIEKDDFIAKDINTEELYWSSDYNDLFEFFSVHDNSEYDIELTDEAKKRLGLSHE